MEEFIRVLGILQLQDFHLQSRLFQDGNGPLGGVLTGLVAVIDQHDLLGVAGHQGGLLLGQTGAQRGDGIVKSELVQGHHIHIALHQDQVIFFCFLSKIEAKKVLSLVENNGFRGIQILGRIIILLDDPAAKADHIAPDIDDGEHEPVPETVK